MIELKLVDEEEVESCEDPGSTEVTRVSETMSVL